MNESSALHTEYECIYRLLPKPTEGLASFTGLMNGPFDLLWLCVNVCCFELFLAQYCTTLCVG